MVGGRSYLFQPPRRAVGPSGINPSFLGLSRYQGWVTHVLLTRSPLSPGPKAWFSLDLHVLSAPPAFVLSQDQTLREDGMPAPGASGDPFTSSVLLAQRPSVRFRRIVRTTRLKPSHPRRPKPVRDRGSRHRRTFAVEFSKTSAVSERRRKKDLRLAPGGLRGCES